MNTFLDSSTIPALIAGADKKLTALLTELTDLGARREAAWADRDRAERDLDTAPRADTAALAGALRAGHADPGPVATREAEGRQTAAQRLLDALEVAAGQVGGDIAARVTTVRPALTTRVTAARTAAGEALDTALDAVTETLTALAAAQHADAWVAAVVGLRSTPRPPEVTVLVADRMGQRHHVDVDAVTAALSDLAHPARVQQREQEAAQSMAPGVAQNLTPYELVHGRGAVEG